MKKEQHITPNKKYNRLIAEKSPYLLQHASNPVEWYPWGEEAFEKAKKEDKPIFLSIGYSTCHWCHVMAHESFEDPKIAEMMNDIFINVKVDREERPEIDSIYMDICQMITGRGGWPLTIIMDAEKRPFTAGTYFPKESRFGRIGLIDFIQRIKEHWYNNREELFTASNEVFLQLQAMDFTPGEGFTREILDDAFKEATLAYDEVNGGFHGAPKFPTPHKLLFLLRYWKRTGNEKALSMVEKTLIAMRLGGIYDHIGFGFHRYSTDAKWILPHFEKMLYDQALLLIAYTEAYQSTKKDFYRTAIEEIASYVMREMTSKEGGFYSAEDADSEGEEGKFYTWTVNEIETILKDNAKLFLKIYNFDEQGNFKEEATQEKKGRNILYLRKNFEELAFDHSIDEKILKDKLEESKEKLFSIRENRIPPHKDDKILTDWNGLMIAALSIAGSVLENESFISAAKKTADFILTTLRTETGRLYHRYRKQEVAIRGMINDYAYLIWGLLELYQATFEVKYLEALIQLNDLFIRHFWDNKKGAFFFTPNDGEQILVRKKEIYDGAIPSGNSIAMLNLLKITRITANSDFEEKAMQINRLFSNSVEGSLLSHSMFLCALEYVYGSSFEVVIVGDKGKRDLRDMLQAIRREFIPNKVLLVLPINTIESDLQKITDFVKYKTMKNDAATAYVCINRFCKFPTNDISKMLELLEVK